MDWWNQAIFDTCSVITLDKIRQIDPKIGKYFPKTIRVIDATFAEDQLREDTVNRMRPIVTADRQLGKAIKAVSLNVADMATLLRELVQNKKISRSACETLLAELAKRMDLILGTTTPSWNDLRSHSFPHR